MNKGGSEQRSNSVRTAPSLPSSGSLGVLSGRRGVDPAALLRDSGGARVRRVPAVKPYGEAEDPVDPFAACAWNLP